MDTATEENPNVTDRDSILVLCNELADNITPIGPTKEYPYFMAFRSKTPIVMCAVMASLTEEFYQHVKNFPKDFQLQKELYDVFRANLANRE